MPKHYLLIPPAGVKPRSGQESVEDAALLEVCAGLAESWHVDGEFARAAAGWEALVEAGYEVTESALKAGISHISAMRKSEGFRWLSRARELGTAAEEIFYVTAHHHWANGDWERALADFRRAEVDSKNPSLATNSLGVLLWRLGREREARDHFARAIEQDPNDPFGLVNRVSTDMETMDPDSALYILSKSVQRAPHRFEAYVLASRVLRRKGKMEAAAEALDMGRLRRLAVRVPERVAASSRPHGEVEIRGSLARESLALELRYRLTRQSPEALLPAAFVVNAGYHRVLVDGIRCDADAAPIPSQMKLAAPVRQFVVPSHAWRRQANVAELAVRIEGTPAPPCARYGKAEVELDPLSAWLPVLVPETPLRWHLQCELPAGLELIASHAARSDGVGLIALDRPVRAILDDGIEVVGGESPQVRHLAAHLARQATALWAERVGPTGGPPTKVVIVDRPKSSFCYTRPGYIRLASGIFGEAKASALVLHEVGHLWWGAAARFAEGDGWLAEALAEYTLHMAEANGLIPGYAQASLTALARDWNGAPPSLGLEELADRKTRQAAYALRVKGGFMIAALRRLLGDQAFDDVLRLTLAFARSSVIDAYTFFAIASRRSGSSLHWFANQWVHRMTAVSLTAEEICVKRDGQRYELSFEARCRGSAMPNVPVVFEIECADGSRQRVDVALPFGFAPVTLKLESRPTSIQPDPDCHWYGTTRASHAIS